NEDGRRFATWENALEGLQRCFISGPALRHIRLAPARPPLGAAEYLDITREAGRICKTGASFHFMVAKVVSGSVAGFQRGEEWDRIDFCQSKPATPWFVAKAFQCIGGHSAQ